MVELRRFDKLIKLCKIFNVSSDFLLDIDNKTTNMLEDNLRKLCLINGEELTNDELYFVIMQIKILREFNNKTKNTIK